MGAGASKGDLGSVRDPFRISRETDKDLDVLTFVTTRVLNTPDIYDVNNLSRAGTCGEYAVFMKDIIEKRLLNQLVIDTPEGKKTVYYQNPRKLIPKLEDRKAICSQIAGTAIQAVTTIVACLASIQVAYSPRIVPPQTGGGVIEVRDWLYKNGVIRQEIPQLGAPVELTTTRDQQSRGIQLLIVLEGSRQDLTTGLVFPRAVSGGEPKGLPQLPTSEGLRIQLLMPIRPGVQTDSISALPVRIVDSVSRPWLAGILIKYQNRTYFKSFGKGEMFEFTEAIEALFRRATGGGGIQLETRDQLVSASATFDQIRNNMSAGLNILMSSLGPFLQSVGFTTAVAPAPYGQQQPPPYGYAPPGYGAPPPAFPIAAPPLAPLIQQPTLPAFRQLPGVAAVAAGPSDTAYDIPQNATAFILNAYKRFRDAHFTQSSPATVRAKTLAASVNEDRTVNVGACQDPYWTQPTLGQVYPWATFQYLCVKDLTKAGDTTTPLAVTGQWTKFVSEISEIYEGLGLKLEKGTASTPLLENMRVTGVNTLKACKEGRTGFRIIQDALLRLQGLYEEHVERMWGVLNSLVVVIEDPVREAKVVRLHPKATTGTDTSRKYIDGLANEARDALLEFYVAVERTYAEAIQKAFPKAEA
jgi:hypothetical protein